MTLYATIKMYYIKNFVTLPGSSFFLSETKALNLCYNNVPSRLFLYTVTQSLHKSETTLKRVFDNRCRNIFDTLCILEFFFLTFCNSHFIYMLPILFD